MPTLNDYELALLYSANGDESKMEQIDLGATLKLEGMGLLKVDSSADGGGFVITDAGKTFLASDANANNRGIV